ncbi:hypothetical protein [Streptomyces canus]|uniref:hypothetical protein n=1 Tax=Streptomyces canus TaxID=58343 RepID=UPI0027D8FB3C|nr:hypothetical protein [Streptomyces canus]
MGVYVPVFATAGVGGLSVYAVVFLILISGLSAGRFFATRPVIARLSGWGRIRLPLLLIAVGLLILIEGGGPSGCRRACSLQRVVQCPRQLTVDGAGCVQLVGSFVQLALCVGELLFRLGDAALKPVEGRLGRRARARPRPSCPAPRTGAFPIAGRAWSGRCRVPGR